MLAASDPVLITAEGTKQGSGGKGKEVDAAIGN
jgi:hypothetical protein